MDIASVIRYRLDELGIEQRDLAVAANVTESYISQLLAKKKTPPAPDRTEIYEKIAKVLKLPGKELSRLADTQRREELKRKVLDPPRPLFPEVRKLILGKCVAANKGHVTEIFNREPFGEMERFITQRVLEIAKGVAKTELGDSNWIFRLGHASKQSAKEASASLEEFLMAKVFEGATETSLRLVDVLIQSWDIQMGSFAMEVGLNCKLSHVAVKKLEFREVENEPATPMEPALEEFLKDEKLSAGLTEGEAEFLKRLRMEGKRPSVLYYYRELQNLRDPINFAPLASFAPPVNAAPQGSVSGQAGSGMRGISTGKKKARKARKRLL